MTTTPSYFDTVALRATPVRRVVSVGMMGILGALLLYLAATSGQMALGYKLFLLVLGAGSLYLARRAWAATEHGIELRDAGLVQTDGTVICRLDEIEKVERGMFAFKPSNGFVVVLKSPAARAWAPGLWWRLGRRVGVGGVTPSGAGKAMADMLALKLDANK